jgi:patatin-related protein
MNDQANADSAGSVDPGNGQVASRANGDAPPGSGSTGTDRVHVSLATQRLRLAVTMSGGVSLAVWMGGVAREINLLTQASDLRVRGPGEVGVPAPARPPAGGLALRVRDLYGQLLDLVDMTATVDVLSGTSAGGVNAAILGLANARRLDIGSLRDLWLQAGAFDQLLRDPHADPNPPSLLKGDEQLLAALRNGLNVLTESNSDAVSGNQARETTVHITTTLLHGQNGQFTDDYGNSVGDSDNHGLFTFTTEDLVVPGVIGALALAARSSASFPAAFEPSFIPIGDAVADGDEPKGMQGWHPDMQDYTGNIMQSAWVADGGLLANRPLGPTLQSVMARTTDREVRRVMLYVVPTSESPPPPAAPDFTKPYMLGESLRLDLDAMLNQSIAADLNAIVRHNDQVASLANTRMLLARLAGERELCDAQMWSDYRNVETVAVAAPIAEAVTACMASARQWQPLLSTGGAASARVRAALGAAIGKRLPTRAQTLADVIALGLPAYESARAAVLDLIYAGYQLARNTDDVAAIASAHQHLNALSVRPADLTGTVRSVVEAADCKDAPVKVTWDSVLEKVSSDLLDQLQAGMRGVPAASPPAPDDDKGEVTGNAVLSRAWGNLLDALASLSPIAQDLARDEEPLSAAATDQDGAATATSAAGTDAGPATGQQPPLPSATAVTRKTTPQSTADRRLSLATLIGDYLTFLYPPDPEQDSGDTDAARQRLALRLAELHAAVRITSPVWSETEQRLELIEVSADTRTMLAPNHTTASSKLTGLQLHHFAAFYKGTWRANDWMWGRLDGAGWLAQILLDPRRILAVVKTRNVTQPADWFFRRLCDIVGAPGKAVFGISEESLRKDLAFLDKPDKQVPASLPNVALWVALALQRYIAAEELTAVAGQIRNPVNGSPRGPALGWLDRYDTALTSKPPGGPGGGILNPSSIYKHMVEAGVPSRKRVDTFLGGLEALLGEAPAAVRTELGYLQKGEQFIPPALNVLQSWAGEHLAAAADQGTLRPVFDETWVDRVAATLDACPIADEKLSGEIGTPLFTRTVTQALAVATGAATATGGKPPATLAPTISMARTVTTAAYLVTKDTAGGAKALIWLGLLALGVGIASMFVSIPIVGTVGLAVLLTGAILLGIGLWRRSLYVAGLVVAIGIALIAAAPWLPYLHRHLFSWLENTAVPFMDHHAWVWTALFLLVLLPPVWMIAGEFTRRRLRRESAGQVSKATPVTVMEQPDSGGSGKGGMTGNDHGPVESTSDLTSATFES